MNHCNVEILEIFVLLKYIMSENKNMKKNNRLVLSNKRQKEEPVTKIQGI